RLERGLADVEQALRLVRDLADAEGGGRVGDQAVLRDADVEADHVAVLRPVVAGDAVDDHLVRGDADRGREALVALRRRAGIVRADVVLGDAVELRHRATGLELLLEERERARDDHARRRHQLDLARALPDDHAAASGTRSRLATQTDARARPARPEGG